MSTSRALFRWSSLTFAALMIVASPRVAFAHPRLKRSVPAAGQQLSVVPDMLRLWFSEEPEIPLTSLTLSDDTGNRVQLGAIERDSVDKSGVAAHITSALTPGRYVVTWRTAAADGHPTHGSFTFTVLDAAAAT